MKKLAGLLAFAVALACAILLTKYYSPATPTPTQPAAPAGPQQRVSTPNAPETVSTAPSFRTQQVTLDLASKKATVSLALERGPLGAAPPERVWVWAYFFTQESPGKYCEGGPVEVKRPFDAAPGRSANVNVEFPVANCPAPRGASTTIYARVNVSAESAFAARLAEQRITYDITQASPVTLQGARK